MLPVLLPPLTQIDEELQNDSIVLMMLGTLWYVLFNVFTGTPLIPADILEAPRFHRSPQRENFPPLVGYYCYLWIG